MQLLNCDEQTWKTLERRANSQTEPYKAVFRARIILGYLDEQGVMAVSRSVNTRPNTVIKWRDWFVAKGLQGLENNPRPGAPRQLPVDSREQILRLLEEPAPAGQAVWDGKALAQRLTGR